MPLVHSHQVNTTGFEGTIEYFNGISKSDELKEAVGDYGFHVYCPNMIIDSGDRYSDWFI